MNEKKYRKNKLIKNWGKWHQNQLKIVGKFYKNVQVLNFFIEKHVVNSSMQNL